LCREAIADVLLKLGAPIDALAHREPGVRRLHELTEGEPLLVCRYAESLWDAGREQAHMTPKELENLKTGFDSYFEHWLSDQQRLWAEEGQNIDGETSTKCCRF
jgi:hypothetical protein